MEQFVQLSMDRKMCFVCGDNLKRSEFLKCVKGKIGEPSTGTRVRGSSDGQIGDMNCSTFCASDRREGVGGNAGCGGRGGIGCGRSGGGIGGDIGRGI